LFGTIWRRYLTRAVLYADLCWTNRGKGIEAMGNSHLEYTGWLMIAKTTFSKREYYDIFQDDFYFIMPYLIIL
jgi:hypothetical protein